MLSQSPKRERHLTPNSDFRVVISAVIVAALGLMLLSGQRGAKLP
jgi:hypothetical protein